MDDNFNMKEFANNTIVFQYYMDNLFEKLDEDNDGYIDQKDLFNLYNRVDGKEIIRNAIFNNNFRLNKDEFVEKLREIINLIF